MRTLLICVALLLVVASVFAVNERPGSRTFKNPVRVLQKLYEQHLEELEATDPRADSSTSSGVGNACGESCAIL